jgi:hypothetical protein
MCRVNALLLFASVDYAAWRCQIWLEDEEVSAYKKLVVLLFG